MEQVKEQFLRNVEVPKETDSYKPVPHGDLIDRVRKTMSEKDIVVDSSTARVNRKGTVATLNFDTHIDPNNPDLLARLSVQNSYDKSVALTFHAGTCIKICSNGAFASDEEFAHYTRKHTGKVNEEMMQKMETAINQLQKHITMIDAFKKRATNVPLDFKQMSEIAGELFVREEIINTKQMSILKQEIQEPSFQEFTNGNAWSFYNHVTYALKESHPREYLEKHKNLHSFVEQNVLV
jgi:hypothetical protein